MALFGGSRDISMFRHVNRELMQNIISQQCALYQIRLEETIFNMYGEAANEKFYNGPFLLYCLIDLPNQEQPTNEEGVTWEWAPTFKFLRDDLVEANVFPQIGDIIFYKEAYYEIHTINEMQYFTGKNPDYINSPNPLEPNLADFGYNVSIVCNTHYIPADRVGLSKERT
jgi:hypothetical protein